MIRRKRKDNSVELPKKAKIVVLYSASGIAATVSHLHIP